MKRVEGSLLGLSHERSKSRDDWPIGELAVGQLDALAYEHLRAAGARTILELCDQPTLAHAGIAGHQ
jgi:hypothetical protein